MRGSAREAITQEIEEKLEARVRPILQVHGGDLTLLAVSDGVVSVRFEGACVGCPLRSITMAVTVGPALRAIDGVESVRAEGVRLSQASTSRLDAAVQVASPGLTR
jgi:Fe-S cluster biogenesis protein NfuA